MNNDVFKKLKPLPSLWYEDEEGKKYILSKEELENPDTMFALMDGDYPYQHFLEPEVTESITTKDSQIMALHKTINCIEPIVINLVENYGWSLIDAVTLGASTCERCLNILIDKSGGEKYKKEDRDSCNTHCELCKIIDPEYEIKYLSEYKELEVKAMEKKEFKFGDIIKYILPENPHRIYFSKIVGIEGNFLIFENGEKISELNIIGKVTREEIEDAFGIVPEISSFNIGDEVQYIDRDDDEIFIAKIVNIKDRLVTMSNGSVIDYEDILNMAPEYEIPFKKKDLEKYQDPSDILLMKPGERQIKIDKLLDRMNETKTPKEKMQISEQVKSLKASLNITSANWDRNYKFFTRKDGVQLWVPSSFSMEEPSELLVGPEDNSDWVKFEDVKLSEEEKKALDKTLKRIQKSKPVEIDPKRKRLIMEIIDGPLAEVEMGSPAFDPEDLVGYVEDSGRIDNLTKEEKEMIKREASTKIKKKASEKSSWSVDKKNSKIFRDEKAKVKALLLNHGEIYAVGQKVVLAGCLGSDLVQIERLLGKGKYIVILHGIKAKVNKENLFPTDNEDLK